MDSQFAKEIAIIEYHKGKKKVKIVFKSAGYAEHLLTYYKTLEFSDPNGTTNPCRLTFGRE